MQSRRYVFEADVYEIIHLKEIRGNQDGNYDGFIDLRTTERVMDIAHQPLEYMYITVHWNI
jgi:hypothetical protein